MRTKIPYPLLALLLALTLFPAPGARAQVQPPALAIDQAIGATGTRVGFTGVGFTPGGGVNVLLTTGAGLVVAQPTANGNGGVTGSFNMPANVPEVGTAGRVSVSAIDRATGRETLPSFFILTASQPLDYDLPNGRFFTQTNGNDLGVGTSGYAVVNNWPFSVPVRFWDEFKRLGNVALVGYPISQLFVLDGFVTQVFQKAVFQWRPEVDQAYFINVFDVLHDRGYDDFLLIVRSTPRQIDPSFDANKSAAQVIADRLALLDANPAMRSAYYAVDNPLPRFGLPTSRVVDNGDHFVIRLQRAVLQQWKADVPWAKASQVTIANGGAIGVEVGTLYPAFATRPQPQPSFSQRIVVYNPAKGDRVRSGFLLRGDAQVFEAVSNYQLIGENGALLSEGPLMATAGAPEFGRFSKNVTFSVTREQPAVLRVFERSAADGSIVINTLVNIPLVLAP
ncbi:MAG: Gmad2 immunoglobulin-like domain-containing protein [Chloroflexota bacterium]